MEMAQMYNTLSRSDLQNSFLNALVENKVPVAVYLKNGIKLKAVITGFDHECIMIDYPTAQLIQLTAISTVAPVMTFEKFDSLF
jgi:host factor-I protein